MEISISLHNSTTPKIRVLGLGFVSPKFHLRSSSIRFDPTNLHNKISFRLHQCESKIGSAVVTNSITNIKEEEEDTNDDDVEALLKMKEWEIYRYQEELAIAQGITIRRHPPTDPPSDYSGALSCEFEIRDKNPRNILEEIIWNKHAEVSQLKDRIPLISLRKAIDNAPPVKDFIGALKASTLRTGLPGLIAEVKKASPSRGLLRENFDPVEIAQAYEKGGAACLSILTDEKYFQGSFENLEAIRKAGIKCPLLCKEFIIDAWQIYYARSKGADAILLIASVLSDLDIRYMLKICRMLGLATIVEVHNEQEMDRVTNIDGVQLIGINNRNLGTFEVDISNTKNLLQGKRGQVVREKDIIIVGESGLFTPDDIAYVLEAGVKAVDYKEHSFSNGEEECLCRFLLFWQNGPKAGQLTLSTIEHICLIQVCTQVDPRLAMFLKMSIDRLKSISSNASLISEDNGSNDGANANEIFRSQFKHKCRPKEAKWAKQSKSTTQATEGSKSFIVREWIEEDEDMGGGALFTPNLNKSGSGYILVIENVEKDLSQSSLAEFIHEQSDIETEAFVFPSFPSDAYARGFVAVDCKEKLEKLLAFIDNPDHLIVSSRGRPWIVSEKTLMPDTFGWSSNVIPNSQAKGSRGKIRKCDELRIVKLGSEEYTRAKKMKYSFTEFSEHGKTMQKMLESEMKEILHGRSTCSLTGSS